MDALSPNISGASVAPVVNNKIRVPGSNLTFSAACFGGLNDNNWSLGPLQWPEDAQKHPDLAERVGVALYNLGVKNAYAPNPTQFNGQVVAAERLDRKIILPVGPENVSLWRNQSIPADASFLLKSGDAGVFSAGGCGVVVLEHRGVLMFGHAGRESLLDRKRVLTQGAEADRPQDLIANMMEALHIPKGDGWGVNAWLLYFIHPREFEHRFDNPEPEKAAYNQAAAAYLPKIYQRFGWINPGVGIHIDLPLIAREQLLRWGVYYKNIHLEHAYLNDELPTTRNGGGRYLVAIVRH